MENAHTQLNANNRNYRGGEGRANKIIKGKITNIPSAVKLESRGKTRRNGSVEWPLDRFTSKPEESV